MIRNSVVALATLSIVLGTPSAASAVSWGWGDGDGGSFCASDLKPPQPTSLGAVRGPRGGGIVLPQTWPGIHARLSTRRKSYRAGSDVFVRTENIGTELLNENWEYEIERLTEAGWVKVGPHQLKFPRSPGPQVASGRAGCNTSFMIPAKAVSGLYRIVKQVEYGPRLPDGEYATLTLTREFKVKPKALPLGSRLRPLDPYCAGAPVRDYARPFSFLPPVQPPPEYGPLPFGPSSVTIYHSNLMGTIAARRVGVYYGISNQFHAETAQLGWQVRGELMRIDRVGQILEVVDDDLLMIDALQGGYGELLRLVPPKEVGLYRADLTIIDANGTVLASYGDYLRVLPTRVQARLGIRAHMVHRGETVVARLENPGTEKIGYGAGFQLEQREGSSWEVLPGWEMPPMPRLFDVLSPGATAKGCISLRIGRQFAPGHYRIVKTVYRVENAHVVLGTRTLTRPFTVLP